MYNKFSPNNINRCYKSKKNINFAIVKKDIHTVKTN